MTPVLKKLTVSLLSAFALGYVIYYTSPPDSWNSASITQILEFFLPVIILMTALADIFLKNLARSLILGFAVMFLIILESLYFLNIITLSILILLLIILFYIFDTPPITVNNPSPVKKLTTDPEIPKLRLSILSNRSKLTRFQQRRRRRQRK